VACRTRATKSSGRIVPRSAAAEDWQHGTFHIPYINPVAPATGCVSNGTTLTPVNPQGSVNLYAYGGIWSSAQDISFWDIALAGSGS
jgi:hypothetical protein